MLKSLRVSNLAVVERAEADFVAGYNAITGETGAGKSVLMGALHLALGGRADSAIVRDGAKEAEVEAEFDGYTIRRTVTSGGKSRAWINDESVTIAELKTLGLKLADIHGPNANESLGEESFQRAQLDTFAKVDSTSYHKAYEAWASIEEEIALLKSAAASEDELDLLRYQVNELEEAKITEDDDTVELRHSEAAHAAENIQGASAATEALGGDGGAEDALAAVSRIIQPLKRHLPEAEEWETQLEDIICRLQALSRTVADKALALTADGGLSLDELDARLSLLDKLERKYLKGTVSEGTRSSRLLDVLKKKRDRLDALENRDVRLLELGELSSKAHQKLLAEGAKITKLRVKTAGDLAAKISKELKELGFKKANFSIDVRPSSPAPHGCDEIVYMFEPNLGDSPRPLAAIASSGETARVMLALKTVLSASMPDSVLIFDEVDANVGGETARAVGEKLLRASQNRQVIAITHSPQSAVFADRHLSVRKMQKDSGAETFIKVVEGEEKIDEIARMLGGENLTSVVRRHAEELVLLKNKK